MGKKPKLSKTPLGDRLLKVREMLGYPQQRAAFAETVGLTEPMLGYYERGDRTPDALALSAYSTAHGISLTWLITGGGEMFADASKAPASKAPVDPELMELIYKGVESVHRAKGLATPPHRIAVLATHMYNDLQGRVSDLRDTVVVDAVLPVLRKELDDRLEEAKVKPGTGKRTAS